MKKKIKVCHFTSVHNVFDDRIYLKECISLADAGFEVYLIAPDTKSYVINKVNIIGVDNNYNSRLKRILLFTRKIYLAALNVDADIYHFHDAELLYFGNKLKQKGKKVIYDSHEDVPRQLISKPYLNKFLLKIISYVFEKYEKRISAKLDYIITATPFIRDIFLKVNENSVDICNYPILSEFERDVEWSSRKDELCYIGGIFKIRGIFEILDTLEKYKLNLAGLFSPPELEDEIVKHKNWKNVNYYGFVNRDEIVNILSKSKIGLVTLHPTKNYMESQPIKMFEYMLAGIPVIASKFPLWIDIIEKYKCGICVDPLNKDEIAKAINYLMENPEKAEKMGQNGRKAVETAFNWETEEKKLIRIYEELLQK